MSEFEELRCDRCDEIFAYIDGDMNAAIVCKTCYEYKIDGMTKKPSEMDVGERMVDYMTDDLAKLTNHICMIKICENNHFCVLDNGHPGDCASIKHGELCK